MLIFLNSLTMLSFVIYITWIVLFSLMLRDEFSQITQDVAADQMNRHTDEQTSGHSSTDVELFRQRYLALTKVVRLIDDVMCLYNLLIFVVLIPMVCISIYLQLRTEMDMTLRTVAVYGLCTWLLFLGSYYFRRDVTQWFSKLSKNF